MGALAAHRLELSGVAGDPGSAVHGLDPRAKLLGLLAVTVVGLTAPLSAWPVYVACLAVLVALGAAARVTVSSVWRRGAAALVLVLPVAAVVPLVRAGGAEWALGPLTVHEAGLATLAAVSAKTTIGVGAAVLLTATTSFPELVRGLEALRTPRLLVVVATLMHRYLFVVADEVRRTSVALAARGGRPGSLLRSGVVGRLVATVFLRSYGRGERVHRAMLARGYAGTLPRTTPLVLAPSDVAFLAAIAAALLPLRIVLGVA